MSRSVFLGIFSVHAGTCRAVHTTCIVDRIVYHIVHFVTDGTHCVADGASYPADNVADSVAGILRRVADGVSDGASTVIRGRSWR